MRVNLHFITICKLCAMCVVYIYSTHPPQQQVVKHLPAHTIFTFYPWLLCLHAFPRPLRPLPTPQALFKTMLADMPRSKLQSFVCQLPSENGRKSLAFIRPGELSAAPPHKLTHKSWQLYSPLTISIPVLNLPGQLEKINTFQLDQILTEFYRKHCQGDLEFCTSKGFMTLTNKPSAI